LSPFVVRHRRELIVGGGRAVPQDVEMAAERRGDLPGVPVEFRVAAAARFVAAPTSIGSP
jgi:hypothetical protein